MQGGLMRGILRTLCLLFCLFAVPVLARASDALIGSGCSVSMPGYLEDLAKEYRKETGVKVYIRGGGSLLGLNDLHEKRVDFAASCAPRRPQDPKDFEFITVAWDALVFIVNPGNPVSSMSYQDVRNIYEGRLTNWKQLGGPDLAITSFISTPKGMGGVMEAVQNMILKGKPLEPQSNSSLQASSVAIWEQLVEKTPGGFASTGFASARKRRVKMLKLNGVMPTKENIITGRYPLKRPLYLVVKKNARSAVRKFIDFVLSRKGQKFISEFGIPSITDIR
jgi:phosphate transport system substrate-binding protein